MDEVKKALQEPKWWFRWGVLIVMSMTMFGNYYIYDSISPLADVLKSQLGFSDANIGLMNAMYSFPNFIMVLIGGIVIDRIGTKKAVIIFTSLCMLGSLITVSAGNVYVMAVGRLVFGLGAESMIVAVTTAIAKWFRGKELSFAFGINLTIARMGSFAALNSPTWAKALYGHWRLPLLISVAFGAVALAAAVLYIILERTAESKFRLGKGDEPDKINLKDIFSFSKSYWLIVALCVTFYSAVFPFQTFAVKFFQEAHGTTREFGGFLSSMLTAFAMIGTPLFGFIVDRVGRRSLFMFFGSALLIPVYLLMGYTQVNLLIPMSMMGIAFSMIPAVMWPSVAYIVDQKKLGTAYGLMTMIQNFGLAGFNMIVGWANDFGGASAQNPEGYRIGMWIFSISGFLGLVFAFLLRRSETGPNAHGLETITAGGKKEKEE